MCPGERKDRGYPELPEFSVRQYRDNGRRITRGSDFLVGTEDLDRLRPRGHGFHNSGKGLVHACEGNEPMTLPTSYEALRTCFGGRSAANGRGATD